MILACYHASQVVALEVCVVTILGPQSRCKIEAIEL